MESQGLVQFWFLSKFEKKTIPVIMIMGWVFLLHEGLQAEAVQVITVTKFDNLLKPEMASKNDDWYGIDYSVLW